ncbi:hypothetical protein VYU27_008777 [Nannochloropsis oceanica]
MLEGVDVVQLSALESAIAIAIDTTFLLNSANMAEIESIKTAFVDVPYYHFGPGQHSSSSSTTTTTTTTTWPAA